MDNKYEDSPYDAFFNRELLVAAFMLEDIYPQLLRSTITFSAENQGVVDSALLSENRSEEQQGRIPHENRTRTDQTGKAISQGKQGWDWPYYGSVDTTPLFVSAIGKQTKREGIGFLTKTYTGRDGKEHTYEDSLISAVDWIKRRLDSNKEGLLECTPLFESSLENQAWKDSWDSYHHADGTLANGKQGIASIEVQAYAYDALMHTSRLFRLLFGPKYLEKAEDLEKRAKNLQAQVLKHFWVEEKKGAYFALGTDHEDSDLRPLKIRTSNMGHLLNSDIVSGDTDEMKSKRDAIVGTLFSDEMLSPNGIRTLGKSEVRFRPGSYHNGSVWLWDNYYIGLGLEKFGYKEKARLLYATIASNIQRSKRYPEFVRGGERPEPLLNSHIIDVSDTKNNRQNRVEQLSQEMQLFTVAAAVAIEHKNKSDLCWRLDNDL